MTVDNIRINKVLRDLKRDVTPKSSNITNEIEEKKARRNTSNDEYVNANNVHLLTESILWEELE